MNTNRIVKNLLWITLISISIIGCQQSAPEINERAKATEFKGMELYSWRSDSGEWEYSILVGTNRYKTITEVIYKSMSMEEVKESIAKMAIGETIIWSNQVESSEINIVLEFPPIEVINELRSYASIYNVKLMTL
jgi:hypothetical protein